MTPFAFDIETASLTEAELAAMLPPFDPTQVKAGNLGPEKAAAKIAEAEAAHRREFFDRAALDPMTGRVLAIGVLYPHSREFIVVADDDEASLLREFWNLTRGEMGRINTMIGFNSNQFDLPFLIRRSWKHRVPVPFGIRRGRYWSEHAVDLRDDWQLGDRQARGSLDAVAKHLGVGAKNGDGKDFARLWQTDRAKAIEYLRNDVELTARVAEVLGAIERAA